MKTTAANDVDLMFRAFADPTRLRILHLLVRGELCVCDLVDTLEVPQPTASRHLAYLRNAGLVQSRQEGHWHHYRLTPARGAFHKKLLECLKCCLGEVPQLAKDLRQLGRCRCC
jgi:ArsR family transcriptional regulator